MPLYRLALQQDEGNRLVTEEMDTGEEQEIQAPAAAASGGGKGKLIIMLVAAVVVLVGVGAGAFMFMGKGGSSDGGHGGDATDQLAQNAEHGGGHGEAPKDDGHGGGHGEAKKDDGHGGGHGGGEEEGEVELTIPLDSVNVNLRGSKGGVRLGFWVQVANAEAKTKVESSRFQIKDAMIMMLSGKTRADLQSEEGQLLIKKQARKKFEELVGPGSIQDVGFAELIFF